jgi:hypothetical protein
MVTVKIKQIHLKNRIKKPDNARFEMSIFCEDYLLAYFPQLFKTLQECSHYAEGKMLEMFIRKNVVYTILEDYTIEDVPQNIYIHGLPYGVHYKQKTKHEILI